MLTEVRAEKGAKKFLFAWNPAAQIIEIIVKKKLFRVKLYSDPSNGKFYKILEEREK